MWRSLETADFFAALDEREAEVFARNEDEDGAPIRKQIAAAVAHARGCIRSGRKCRMPADESLLPDMLVAPTMDFAVFELLTRLRRNVNDSRTKAWERANALFDKIAEGRIVPEDYGEDVTTVSPDATPARASFRAKRRALGRHMEDGL